jgi:hypothetical protein
MSSQRAGRAIVESARDWWEDLVVEGSEAHLRVSRVVKQREKKLRDDRKALRAQGPGKRIVKWLSR